MNNICVIGIGYVGLVAAACFAQMGNTVICVDNDINKLHNLENGILPMYEPGLEELVNKNIKEKRLTFTSDFDFAVKNSFVCFITVGTPQSEDGSADLKYILDVAEHIGKAMNGYKIIVDKSTVPVGTADNVTRIIRKYYNSQFDVVSNPEFLRQGSAVDDFLHPERLIIGSDSQKAAQVMLDIYSPVSESGAKVIVMDVKSAEMTKYAANVFLATKISFMNEIANLCERVCADVEMVRLGLSTDSRIGDKFLYPGIGYGGSCIPKDVKALIKTAESCGCEMSLISSAHKVNENQRKIFIDKITKRFDNNLSGKIFGVWGLSYKPETNDMREAPSVAIINTLLSMGALVNCYDPKAMDSAKSIFNDTVTYCSNPYQAIENADAMLLLTEWAEFRKPDFEKIKKLLKQNIIFDGRNQYNPDEMMNGGFEYYCIGRSV